MPERYLLDTNVISETSKPAPSARVLHWIGELEDLCLSTITLYELARGIQQLRPGRRRRFLEAWFDELLAACTQVVSFDHASALAAAELETVARRQGKVIETRDLFILASARAHGLRIATGNVNHFAGYGVMIHDPFAK